MKSLSQPSFFRVFDLLLGGANPGFKLSSWTHDGVNWERERHSFAGANHGQTIEIVTVTRPGKRGWSIMIVKEYWWAGKENKPLKTLRWAKPLAGQRTHILEWFRAQEVALRPRWAASDRARLAESAIEDEGETAGEMDDN